MVPVFVGVVPLYERTLELLNSVDRNRLPPAPYPKKWKDESGRMMGWVFGPVMRPEFTIDLEELPY